MFNSISVSYKNNFDYSSNYPCINSQHTDSIFSAVKSFSYGSFDVLMKSKTGDKQFQNSFCYAPNADISEFFTSLPWRKSSVTLNEAIGALTVFSKGALALSNTIALGTLSFNAMNNGIDIVTEPASRMIQRIPAVARIGLRLALIANMPSAAYYSLAALGAGKWVCEKIHNWFWRGIDTDRLLD